jgi:cytidine deaminase
LTNNEATLTETEMRELIEAARLAREAAYAPYSHFSVGAALLASNGRIYPGCNVENASFGLTICAERTAVVQAISQGARDFSAVAVVTQNGVTPCGACRQVLAEFNPDMQVIVADMAGHYRVYYLTELLPAAFVPEQLNIEG